MSQPRTKRAKCPHCEREFEYERYHSGFGDEGYMYCDRDETVLTWNALKPAYGAIVPKLPWMLDANEQRRVENGVKACPFGGHFAFANPPLCPYCYESIAFLVPDRIYYVVVGRRIDADAEDMWVTGTASNE